GCVRRTTTPELRHPALPRCHPDVLPRGDPAEPALALRAGEPAAGPGLHRAEPALAEPQRPGPAARALLDLAAGRAAALGLGPGTPRRGRRRRGQPPHLGQPAADHPRRPAGHRARCPARRLDRHPPVQALGPGVDGSLAVRPLGALVRHRERAAGGRHQGQQRERPADLRVRRRDRRGRRLHRRSPRRPAAAPGAADDRADPDQRGLLQPDPAQPHARLPRLRLRPHRPRQGPPPLPGGHEARTADRADPHRDLLRLQHRHAVHRRHVHGDHVLVPRHGRVRRHHHHR
ncbi:MAG: Oligopeptide transport system permease protein OppB, partial [uncultured Friedmanniella sp.]